MMKRRDALIGLLALGSAPGLLAQSPPRIPRVVWLTPGDEQQLQDFFEAFRAGMKDLGYENGSNVTFQVLEAKYSPERLERLAADLVASQPAVIVTQGGAYRPIARLTKTLPVVSAFSGDLVDAGLVASFSHPRGNVTGIQLLAYELVGKRIELLKEILPKLRRIAVIADPAHAGEHRELAASRAAADRLGMEILYYPVKNLQELDAGLAAARAAGAEALVLFPDAVTNRRRAEIAAFALQNTLPTVSGWAHYATAGCLLTYGPNLHASWRRVAYFVDRILKGVKPAEIPVEMPVSFEIAINLKTARAIGVTIPSKVLIRANRVIE